MKNFSNHTKRIFGIPLTAAHGRKSGLFKFRRESLILLWLNLSPAFCVYHCERIYELLQIIVTRPNHYHSETLWCTECVYIASATVQLCRVSIQVSAGKCQRFNAACVLIYLMDSEQNVIRPRINFTIFSIVESRSIFPWAYFLLSLCIQILVFWGQIYGWWDAKGYASDIPEGCV